MTRDQKNSHRARVRTLIYSFEACRFSLIRRIA
jgi:hypothetical protein